MSSIRALVVDLLSPVGCKVRLPSLIGPVPGPPMDALSDWDLRNLEVQSMP